MRPKTRMCESEEAETDSRGEEAMKGDAHKEGRKRKHMSDNRGRRGGREECKYHETQQRLWRERQREDRLSQPPPAVKISAISVS